MSFEVDVARRLGDTVVDRAFSTGAGLTALFGPSGAGKTSVLNMVAGVLRPDRGRIVVGGEVLFDSATGINVPPERRGCGYIFQDGRLFPHLRVRANLLYGSRGGNSVILEPEIVRILGIGHLLDRWPRNLSGGEAQRVAIGRALLSRPRFILMDEPLASLDAERKTEIVPIIVRIRDALGLPVLYVSHYVAEVDQLATTRIDFA